jgi:hypothetical protein
MYYLARRGWTSGARTLFPTSILSGLKAVIELGIQLAPTPYADISEWTSLTPGYNGTYGEEKERTYP